MPTKNEKVKRRANEFLIFFCTCGDKKFPKLRENRIKTP